MIFEDLVGTIIRPNQKGLCDLLVTDISPFMDEDGEIMLYGVMPVVHNQPSGSEFDFIFSYDENMKDKWYIYPAHTSFAPDIHGYKVVERNVPEIVISTCYKNANRYVLDEGAGNPIVDGTIESIMTAQKKAEAVLPKMLPPA